MRHPPRRESDVGMISNRANLTVAVVPGPEPQSEQREGLILVQPAHSETCEGPEAMASSICIRAARLGESSRSGAHREVPRRPRMRWTNVISGSSIAGERTGASVRCGTAGSTTPRGSRSAGPRSGPTGELQHESAPDGSATRPSRVTRPRATPSSRRDRALAASAEGAGLSGAGKARRRSGSTARRPPGSAPTASPTS
jgi:hypothetical protein